MGKRRRAERNAPHAGGERERELIEGCLRALRGVAPVEKWKWGWTIQTDAILEIWIDARRFEFAVQLRRGIRAANVGPIVHAALAFEKAGRQLVICTDRIPDELGATLREHGVGYLDLGGNAYLRGAGLCVLVAGRRPIVPNARGALTGTDVRLLGVFLRDPDAGEIVQKELAARAGIALGAVGRARERLEEFRVLTRVDTRRWLVTDRDVGLRQFAEGWAAVVRHKLRPIRYRRLGRETRTNTLERQLRRSRRVRGCLLGGERAAAALTQGLRTDHATVHTPAGRGAALAKELKLVPDAEGAITVLERFGKGDQYHAAVPLIHPLVVWAECVTVPDERVALVAAELRERYLEAAP